MMPNNILECKMATISIKDVPDRWAEALRQRAARNHRSLQGELMAMLEVSLAGVPQATSAGPAIGPAWRGPAGALREGKSVEQVAREMAAKYPQPVTNVPLGVDITRSDRDAR
jgi:plasmid stability protein